MAQSLAAIFIILLTRSAGIATSIEFPKFGQPFVVGDRLVCLSPDAKRILCFSLTGKALWKRSCGEPVSLFAAPNGGLLVQIGAMVSDLSVETGELTDRFPVAESNDRVHFESKGDLWYSTDARWRERRFKLLDGRTGKPKWTSREVERVVCATPELIVALTVKRMRTEDGIRFGASALLGLNRETGGRKWKVPVDKTNGSPFISSVFMAPHIVFVRGENTLVVLDVTNGKTLGTRTVPVPQLGHVSDVLFHEGRVAVLTGEVNSADFDKNRQTLQFYSLPGLAPKERVSFEVIEAATATIVGKYILSDALYRTACFTRDGKKLWERFQCNRSEPIDGKVYFSDYDDGFARLGSVELANGKERIFHRERIGDR